MKLVDALLGGRRGRRLLLEFALESESILLGEDAENPLNTGMYYASYQADPDRGQGVAFFGPGAEAARNTMVTADEVASLLAAVALVPATEGTLRRALFRSVDSARYWQQPDGHDVIAGSEPVRKLLVRVAEHLAGSADAARWMRPASTADQWSVEGESHAGAAPSWPAGEAASAVLASWRTEVENAERRAMPDRFADPSANFSGEWWSMPPAKLRHSTGAFTDGSPVGLWCVEDGFGWDRAETRRLSVLPSARILEITDAQAWAELCREYPLDVTAQKRHDWYRTTGRIGRWTMPDFSQAARDHDGVHLTVAAYLALAGEAIAIDEDSASVIAGWNPDETYWFTDDARHYDEPEAWECADANSGDAAWLRVAGIS